MITMVPRDEAASLVGLITADESHDPQFRLGFRVAIEAAVGCIAAMPDSGRAVGTLWKAQLRRIACEDGTDVYVVAPTLGDAFHKIEEFIRAAWAEQGEEPVARQFAQLDGIELVARTAKIIR